MTTSEPVQDDLQAAICGETVLIRVSGRGSFKVSSTLKQFVVEAVDEKPVSTVAVDMRECTGMDSTFMGVLAGLACRLKENGRTFELINLSEKNRELLVTLGVDRVVDYYEDAHGREPCAAKATSLSTGDASRKDLAETALQAHRNLIQIDEDNLPKFKNVIEYLRADIDRLNE